MSLPVTVDEIRAARERTAGRVRHTPMLSKEALSARHGVPIHLKGEHLQRTGSFKIRGALNLVSQLSSTELAAGVVAASAGNHAQGVAVAAQEYGSQATIFMPADAALSKVAATRGYGAHVEFVDADFGGVLDAAHAYAHTTGATFVHPYDDPRIVAGQGTLGLEILDDMPEIGTMIVPIGGGGLFAGLAIAIKEARPSTRFVGVQASSATSARASLDAGTPTPVVPAATMADGIAIKQVGALPLQAMERYLDELIIVDEEEISRAIVWSIERAKQVVEGSAASTLAALEHEATKPVGHTVCLLSGGNIDSTLLMSVVRHGLSAAGRYVTLTITVPDRPGELARILQVLAAARVNVLDIDHTREGEDIPVGSTQIELLLQVRNAEHADEVVEALSATGAHVSR